MLKFFERVKNENRLFVAVYDDLKIKSFIAGCRASDLISKIITNPMWKRLEDKTIHVLEMSEKYQTLLVCFEVYAESVIPFTKGEVAVFIL